MTFRIAKLSWHAFPARLLTLAASFASLSTALAHYIPPLNELSLLGKLIIACACCFFALLVIQEFASRPRDRHVYRLTDKPAITQYMHDWIERGGRVAIWTRDLSWAQNSETQRVLEQKASSGELILCLPECNALAKHLADLGAEVCPYGEALLESPKSRFTIAHVDRDGSRVAIGRPVGELHVIDEFAAGVHPTYHVASDLISLVRALNKGGDQ